MATPMTDKTFLEMCDPNNIEELDPELAEYFEEDGELGPRIRHPLVYSLLHAPFLNRRANHMLEYKRKALEEARRERDWHTYVFLHERPWRLDGFADIYRELGPIQYWRLLGEIWQDSENIRQNREGWHSALLRDLVTRDGRTINYQQYRWAMMSKTDRAKLKSLHKTPVLVWRGYCHEGGEQGFSWTTDRQKAVWFARRFYSSADDGIAPTITQGIVDAEHIIAYFGNRGESEVVLLPEDVHVLKITEVP